MAGRWAAPPFRVLDERDDAWDLVIKVKCNETLKRFNARVNGLHFDHDLAALRSKIASAFQFSSDAEFILTYADEDGDVVMLDDENDLRDAAINQKLNPLRINVQLKNSNAGAPRTEQQALNSRSPRSTALEDQLTQVKSAIDEALKFVPEQVPSVLARLSHDLRSRAVSSTPSLAELLDRFAKLMTRNGNMQTSSVPVDGSSCSSSGGPQASRNTKTKHESELMTGSASQPLDMQNSESEAPGLKSVLPEDRKAQAPIYPSVDDPLIFTSSGAKKKSDHKGSTGTECKGRGDSQSKGKSAMSSAVPPVSTTIDGATPFQCTPPPPVGENKLRYWPAYGPNGLISGGLQSRFPPPSIVPPYYRHCRASGNINGDLQSSFPPPPANMSSPPNFNIPSSLPSKDGTYPFGSPYRYGVPSSVTNPEGIYSFGSPYNYGSIPQCSLHRWIQCDGCGVTPIVGPRFKSNVKNDYDLCGACFSQMGSESEYTRLDKPASVSNQSLLRRLPKPKLECRFIKDVTVPDGTSMAPSAPFIKIWRMLNTGCTTWPFGTQLIWVGGDQFAIQSSVKLGVSVNGVAVDQEVDVGVDFLAPAKPGRYISYWRLALPSGEKFGQRVWVLIQVEEPIRTSGSKQSAAINLKSPSAANSRDTELKPFIDSYSNVPRDPIFQYPQSSYNEIPARYHDSIIHLDSWPPSPTAPDFRPLGSTCNEMLACFHEPIIPQHSEPASNALPSVSTAVKVQTSTADPHTSSAGPPSTSVPAPVPAPEAIPRPECVSVPAPQATPLPESVSVPAPEAIPLPESVNVPAPVSVPSAPAPAPAPAAAPVSERTAPLPDEIINHMEQKLLRELERMGFGQADLNKEILRQNKYDLEQSVDDLCGISDWDPLFGVLSELGFDGAEMNNEVAAEDGGGGIKRLAMDLLARVKDK